MCSFGAGGEYPACGTGAAEASDESAYARKRRGIFVALATDFSIDLGFVVAGIVALIVLACYHNKTSEGVWRICFGLGIVVCGTGTVKKETNRISFLFRSSSFASEW